MTGKDTEAAEPVRMSRRAGSYFSWLVGFGMAGFVSALVGLLLLWEVPFRVAFGWVFHALTILPRLLPRWPELLFPVACLAATVWLAHRFLGWWFAARGRPLLWRAGHSAAAVFLLVLGSGAAIAISGIAHQLFWLSQDRLLSDGWPRDRTAILSYCRQLSVAVEEFRTTKGRLPASMQELEAEFGLKTRIDPGAGRPEESFVLVAGRSEMPGRPGDPPWILSPRVRNSDRYVVVFESGSCGLVYQREVEEWLQGAAPADVPQTPGAHD